MATKKSDITPVFNHRKSIALVDTAENLVEILDNLSVCLRHIEEKYVESDDAGTKSSGTTVSTANNGSLFAKLKENLDVARDLTDILKREKWRLNRRQISVELRMGELEEYKTNLKRDMTDMNQTVDVLSMRIVELENALCDAEEVQETSNAENQAIQKELGDAHNVIAELQQKESGLQKQVHELISQRTDAALRQHYQEMSDMMEILLIENQRLKEMIREKDSCEIKNSTSEGLSV
ncbi:uncharacterized protein LOC127854014 isoform X2 [Dreissena polymorpha]|uniref:uncharacterized protein LOC127854014 isoform X2 n=1 Tax=Dreissena polymorpha TaxID=45954 RepID=UPI002264F906|nr:uncharacterized protein LOC127854014 isoform X2 [Dreissena polymorpha]